MKLVIDISDETYYAIMDDAKNTPRNLSHYERIISNGTPLEEVLGEIKGKIQEEIKREYIPYTGGYLKYTIDPKKVLEIIDSHISGKERE